MSKTDASIYIKSSNIEIVKDELKKELEIKFKENGYIYFGGIRLEVVDYSYEINYSRDFIEKHKIKNQLSIFDKKLNTREFTTCISVDVIHMFESIYKGISESIATFLSKKLGTQVTLYFQDSEIPYRAYENGIVIIDCKNLWRKHMSKVLYLKRRFSLKRRTKI